MAQETTKADERRKSKYNDDYDDADNYEKRRRRNYNKEDKDEDYYRRNDERHHRSRRRSRSRSPPLRHSYSSISSRSSSSSSSSKHVSRRSKSPLSSSSRSQSHKDDMMNSTVNSDGKIKSASFHSLSSSTITTEAKVFNNIDNNSNNNNILKPTETTTDKHNSKSSRWDEPPPSSASSSSSNRSKIDENLKIIVIPDGQPMPPPPPGYIVMSATQKAHFDAERNSGVEFKPTKVPSGRRGDSSSYVYVQDVEINQYRNRYVIAKTETLDRIKSETGASIEVRGKYYPDKTLATFKDPPLHLHVSASEPEILAAAINKISVLIQTTAVPCQTAVDKNSPGSGNPLEFRIPISIDLASYNVTEYTLRGKLLGPSGGNFKHVHSTTGTKLQLRGKGSGFLEPGLNGPAESDEPLYLHLIGSTPEGLESAKRLAEDLLKTVTNDIVTRKFNPAYANTAVLSLNSNNSVYNALPPPPPPSHILPHLMTPSYISSPPLPSTLVNENNSETAPGLSQEAPPGF